MAHTIKHLVVLMMENRSFDHLLGFMPGVNGLTGNETNPLGPEGPLVQVSENARTVNDLIPDPGHEFVNVNVQIFGDSTATPPASMEGFVTDYWMVSHDNNQAPNIMKCFTPQTLPVLHTLAQEYAVCDCWYSSVPGSTIPNRLFTHAANSLGSLTQDAVIAPFNIRTIFQEMDVAPNSANYRIYTHGSSILMANKWLQEYKQNRFFDFQDFANDAAMGDLPEYTFIEPAYDDDVVNGIYANSQHPDFPVDEGEALISKVYAALTGSPEWNDTLLLITYDEHGGLYDHVVPPAVARSAANDTLPDVPPSKSPAFAFDRLGVRVPAVFVSPRIPRGTVLANPPGGQYYEHCSIVSTVRKLFCGPRAKVPFNWREAQAATFEDLLVLDNPRADVRLPVPVASDPLTPAEVEDTARIVAAGQSISMQASAGDNRPVLQPLSVPKKPPLTRSPTDLILLMAQAMDYALKQRGIQVSADVNSIYTAQDATTFIRQANAALGVGQ